MNDKLSAHRKPDLLRAIALIGTAVAACVALGSMFRFGRHSPPLLLVIFAVWVLSPFVALALAASLVTPLRTLTGAALYILMLVVALCSLAIYGYSAFHPPRATPASVFVVVPLVSWLLIAIVVPIAALMSGKRSGLSDGQ